MAKPKTLVQRVREAWEQDPTGDKAYDLMRRALRGGFRTAWKKAIHSAADAEQQRIDFRFARRYDKGRGP